MGGGAGNATRHVAIELANSGHSVHVLTSRLPGQSDVDTEGSLVVHRVSSRRISIHQAGLFGAASYLPGAFLKLRQLSRQQKYDIYHFYFGLPTGLLALYVHWVLRKPYIIALRGSDVPGYDNTRGYLRALHKLLAPVNRYVWSKAARVTALSENLRQLAQPLAPEVRIDVIGNGVEARMFPQRLTSPSNIGPKLLCVCRLERRKGLEILIDAMRDLANHGVSLEIVGTGELAEKIQSLIQRYGLEKAVQLPGYVPRERLAEHYARADIFVLPSLSESFGQALLEAMCSGLPVIASRVGGIPETLIDQEGGFLIEPGSSEAIAGAVRMLARDIPLQKSMGHFNRSRALEHYAWAGIATRYESIYASALCDANRTLRGGA